MAEPLNPEQMLGAPNPLTDDQLGLALIRCFPRKGATWRQGFMAEVHAVNRRRTMRAINGG